MTGVTWVAFWCDYTTGEDVISDDAVRLSPEQVRGKLTAVLATPDNFLGLVDSDENCVQFLALDASTVLVDVPDPQRRGSWATRATLDEVLELVGLLGPHLGVGQLPIKGLEFSSWG